MPRKIEIEGKETTVFTEDEFTARVETDLQKKLDSAAAAARREGIAEGRGELDKLKAELESLAKERDGSRVELDALREKAKTDAEALTLKLADIEKQALEANSKATTATRQSLMFRALLGYVPHTLAEFLVAHPSFAGIDLSEDTGKSAFEQAVTDLKERSPQLFGSAESKPGAQQVTPDLGSRNSPTPSETLDVNALSKDVALWRQHRDRILSQ